EDGSNPPRLEVVVGSGPASPVTIKAKGELDNGVKRELKDKTAIAYQPPATATLQLGTDPGADAMLDSFYPRNYGGRNFVQVNENTGNWVQRPVFRFDLGRIPAGSTVLSAELELRLKSIKTPGAATIHRVARSWVEGTKSGTGTADGATWATYDGTNNWTTEGGDFDASAVSEAAITGSETWVRWEIGPLVGQWLSGEPNNGFLLKSDGILEEAEFYSKEEADTTLRPKLTISYACECGGACMSPQGAGTISMVVINPTTLVPADAYKKALFESWGYTVNVIGESANQAAYDSEATTSDVFFISETVNSNQVGNRLVNVPIGVVSQDGSYNSDLGLSSGSSWSVSSTIEVTDTSHYITASFRAGLLDIYSKTMEQLAVSGTAAAGLQTLADTAGSGSLVALEKGAELLGGGSAAGRRVMLPLGREGLVNWDYINSDGRLIVQRAIAWAMGAGSDGSGFNVLLVVIDPANPTAQEVAKQTLLESWGHTVNLIDESASQGEFDAAVAANDVAYVAEDIASGQLGTKLREAPIGVVIEEEKITDEFGISSGETTFTEASIEVTDNTHYITQPFSLGAVTFSSSAQPVGGRGGTLAPGLAVLAERPSSSTSMLDVIETGGVLFDTGTAAGRRVKLPWGGNDFDINSLTTDGLNIMRRAIEWGAAAGVAPTLPIAHWKFDETSGTTAVDSAGGNDGTLAGDASWAPGVLAGGLSLDGAGDRVDVSGLVGSPTSLTITAWVNLASAGFNGDEVVNLGNNVLLRVDAVLQGGTYASYWDGSSYRQTTSGQSLGGSGWRHIAYTFDDAADQQFLYIDGVEAGSSTFATSISYTQASNTTIGAHPSSTSYNFNGQIDDLRIYNVALTAAEIAELATVPAPSGPVAHWKLDETSGTTAVDSIGGHDGTLINGPVWVAGQIDGALDFDGSNDLVSVPHQAIFTQVPMTVSAWFKLDVLPTTRSEHGTIIDKRHTVDPYASWTLYVNETLGDKIRFQIRDSSETGYWLDSAASAVINTWYHVVGTIDESYNAKLYVNGALEPDDDNIGSLFSSDDEIRIGAGWSGGNRLDGVVDDVRFYDRALSAAEISGLYSAGAGGGGGGGGGGSPTIFEVRVATGDDDAEERISNGNVNRTSSDLELISDGSNTQLVGMRFTNVTVPNGANISSAYVQFQVDESNSGATNINIQGQAIDDAPQFTTTNSDISSRSRTSAIVPWAPAPWTTVGEAGPDQRTPDIAAVIQEIVDRPGWASGNDIVIIITGSGERTAEAYNGTSSGAPLLHIEY
ncbi:MAG: DNRLRE domain-containing protein, partial [Xanthomonadales bacterium]|nr:DNRLRE domain-containing protein [Xanthomonadales bacterium]